MSNKLSSNEVGDLAIQSLSLSNSLVEKLELMIENNLFAHRSKQSVKNTIIHLKEYLNKVFDPKIFNKEDLDLWSDIVLVLQNRIDKVLNNEEIIIISNRKEILTKILDDNHLPEIVIEDIMRKVAETEILKF